ncbi:DUF2061 domain-containing protein [Candidatus Woesearchaeota archaeon]|nr:DUF2061 domain-containing protein [Candidatus Woesearchaeota archaeon]
MGSTPERSFVKGLSWETISFIITTLIIYLVYGDISKSLKFSIFLTIIKIPLYFLHERSWKKIRWGKVKYVKK